MNRVDETEQRRRQLEHDKLEAGLEMIRQPQVYNRIEGKLRSKHERAASKLFTAIYREVLAREVAAGRMTSDFDRLVPIAPGSFHWSGVAGGQQVSFTGRAYPDCPEADEAAGVLHLAMRVAYHRDQGAKVLARAVNDLRWTCGMLGIQVKPIECTIAGLPDLAPMPDPAPAFNFREDARP